MELLEQSKGDNATQTYQVKLWWDDENRMYVIRYTWQNLRKKYTRTKSIADPRAAQWYYSYSIHTCRRHIGLEESPLSNLFPNTPTYKHATKDIILIWNQ